MKKLITFITLALFASVSFAAPAPSVVSGGIDLGFKSKLIEQGKVTGTNYVVAGANVEVASFGLGVTTYNAYEGSTATGISSGLFKRVDVAATYKFTSTLADLHLGAAYRNAGKNASLANVRDNVLPSVKLSGKVFGAFPWDVTLLNDTKNRSNNYEGNIKLPLGTKSFKVVPAVGVGFNDPGTATIAALRNVKKYYNGGLGVAYVIVGGTFSVNGYVQRVNLTDNYGQVTGYDAGYSFRF
jgi:hypothetical protein